MDTLKLLTLLKVAYKARHDHTPLPNPPGVVVPLPSKEEKETLVGRHPDGSAVYWHEVDTGVISLSARNWLTLLAQAKAQATIPPFATAVNAETLKHLFYHYPCSRFARSPYNSPSASRRIYKYLPQALVNLPTDWFVVTPTPCDGRYYERHTEQISIELGANEKTTTAEFRPAKAVRRITGCLHQVLVADHNAQPPVAFDNSLATAKYLRTGNVNDVICLPPTPGVIAKWGQTEEDVTNCERFDNAAATTDTYRVREAVLSGKCQHVYVVEGVKKAHHLMLATDDYAVAVSGCWQFDAPSIASLMRYSVKATKEAPPEETERLPLPTIEWLLANGVRVTFVTDVDYVTNPSVWDGVNTALTTYCREYRHLITAVRTKAQCELDGVKQLRDYYSPGNYFAVETPANRKYGYKATKLVTVQKGRNKGKEIEIDHFKWSASGIDDLEYTNLEDALKQVNLPGDNAMFNSNAYSKLPAEIINALITEEDNEDNSATEMDEYTAMLERNKRPTKTPPQKEGVKRTTLKGVATHYLASLDPNKVVVTTGSQGLELFLYCNTTKRYQQVNADNDEVYYALLDDLQDTLINDKHVDSVSRFISQLVDELPAVAALTARELGFKRLSKVKLLSERQWVSLKGGHLIDEQGYLQQPTHEVFSQKQLAVSLEDCKQAYQRMVACDWLPIRGLAKRLDLGATSHALKLDRFETCKRILALEIGLPATGGSFNGVEAIFFQSGCSGGGKTVSDNAVNSILGVSQVATNLDLQTLSTNRFARFNLVDKLVATASDVPTINEQQETTLRNCFGVTLVEQKNKPAQQALLSPVFRFSSNYDKAYTADVAGSMTRRTVPKRYVAPMSELEWVGYTTPDLALKDAYMALLYEQLVVNRVSRHQLEVWFKEMVTAANSKLPRTISNTAQLVVERGCNYTGNYEDALAMSQLYNVASNLAPLYGFDRSKHVGNMADALRAMALVNNSAISQARGLPPIKLSWCAELKDYLLHGFTLDNDWLIAFAVEAQKGANERKAQYAYALASYVRQHKPVMVTPTQQAAIEDYERDTDHLLSLSEQS